MNVRFGSLAAPQDTIRSMAAFGCKADIEIYLYGFASAPRATAWYTPGDSIGGLACRVFSSFIVLAPVFKRFGKLGLAGGS